VHPYPAPLAYQVIGPFDVQNPSRPSLEVHAPSLRR